jgi:hypothetical protein
MNLSYIKKKKKSFGLKTPLAVSSREWANYNATFFCISSARCQQADPHINQGVNKIEPYHP